jgi:hypothetical protein
MRTFDVFDTLIGRWYYYPDSNHDDFNLELKRTFPIIKNVQRLDSNSVLVSDTNYNVDQIKAILTTNNIITYKEIICSIDDKLTGKFWDGLGKQSELHVGDNKHSDYDQPISRGIKAELYNSSFSENEKYLEGQGFPKLAALCRMMRLINPNKQSDYHSVWEEQSQANTPILLLLSNYLAIHYNNNNLLFTQRDCNNLYDIFIERFSSILSQKFYTSRQMYRNPTDNFNKYIDEVVNDNSIIIDLQGTGKTCREYFKTRNKKVTYFTVVNSNRGETDIERLVEGTNGYTDTIEKLNYVLVGMVVDVDKINGTWFAKRDPILNNSFTSIQRDYHLILMKYLNMEFIIETEFNLEVFKYFLTYAEKNCKICHLVRHEDT